MKSQGRMFIAALLSFTFVPNLMGRIITIVPSKDNTLIENSSGNRSDGRGDHIFVGLTAEGNRTRRALLFFDVNAHIQPGATIHSVSLTLHMNRTQAADEMVTLHRVTRDWGEGASEGGTGNGAVAEVNDATWLHTFYDHSLWNQAGGDFNTTASATATVGPIGYYTWGTTPAMVADVQAWIDNPAANFGWLLKGNETDPQTSKRFGSREHPTANVHPLLTLNVTHPSDCAKELAADLNGDCVVDARDLALLTTQWLERGDNAREPGHIDIDDIGRFSFDPAGVTTMRPDIFRPGHFSLFDILVHLHQRGDIALTYHFDETMNAYVIDSINDIPHWWYIAYYDGGWVEDNVFRPDHYPYKDRMTIRFHTTTESTIQTAHRSWAAQVRRLQQNEGRVIVPRVSIGSRKFQLVFENVVVEAHNLRNDTFQDGVMTAIDIIMSLGDQGKITYDLQWYESIGRAGIVKSYWVDRINDAQSSGKCGFVYETGERSIGHGQNHIHIPSDWRVINSPEYGYWFWIELGPCD